MNNTYFILSNKAIIIERLHICTWDFIGSNAAMEIGVEFMPNPYVKDVEIKISLPFLKESDKVTCLMDSLIRDDDNSKFIFNDTIKANKPIKEDKRNGAILEFSSRNSLTVLPIKKLEVKDGICSFAVDNLNQVTKNYVRLYVQTTVQNLAVVKKGITKASYIYDIKVNEKRNLPDHIIELLNNGFVLCNKINSCFCFHVIPSYYNISYLNNNKLKNIRILESEAFNKYLPNTEKMKNNESLIIFNKSEKATDGTYTFFSEFEKETIGNEQIILAIGANVTCSLLFGLFSLRERNWVRGEQWHECLPWEFWFAIVVLILLIGYMVIPWKRLFRRVKKNNRS
ncbi:MAG: hypothetical protein J6X16_00380 [Bacteroidales bacterium]|nr:hypothetical protein [Bacteroidales bacterium]